MIQGLWMGMAGATQYTSLHVLMVLTGGITGILFGTVLRAWPKVGSDAWANAQFLIWNIGVLIMVIGAVVRLWGSRRCGHRDRLVRGARRHRDVAGDVPAQREAGVTHVPARAC
jgi:uncharacterized membrane protein